MLLPSLSLGIIQGAMTIQLLVVERIKGLSRRFKLELTRLNYQIIGSTTSYQHWIKGLGSLIDLDILIR
jgi:hypothetical protein